MPTHPKKADVSLPTLAPLAAPLAELTKDEMRERQRLHVKRTYYRKLNVLQTLRDEMIVLEKQYDGLLAKKRAAESSAPLALSNQFAQSTFHDSLVHPLPHQQASPTDFYQHQLQENNPQLSNVGQPQSLASLRDLYTQISEVKERLRAQNEAMAAAVTEYNRFSQKLKAWIEQDELASSSSGDEIHGDPLGSSSSGSYTPRLAAPISVDVCHAVARATFADMQRFRQTNAFLSTGVSIFGWRDKRVRNGDRVKFSLKKVFHGISPLELSMRGWPVLASASRLPTLYSASIDMKMATLQRVDDDNHVMLRVMTSADKRVQVKSLFVVSRFQIPDGYAILVHSLDRNFLAPYKLPPGVVEQWIDYYTWITFEHFGDKREHTVLDFGGEVQSNPVLGSDMWMLEVLLIALRWETQVYGPIFSIC